jgi:hypothetical protein
VTTEGGISFLRLGCAAKRVPGFTGEVGSTFLTAKFRCRRGGQEHDLLLAAVIEQNVWSAGPLQA